MLQAGHRKIVWLFLLFWMAVLHIWLFEKLMTTSLWALYVNLTLGWYLRRLIPFVWLAGALCMALWQLWSYQNFRRKALEHMKPVEESWMRSVCSQAAAEAGCGNMPPPYQSSAVSTPLVLGFAAPVMLVPEETYTWTELRMVFLHECTHVKKKDLWYKLIFTAGTCVLWFQPLLYLLKAAAYRDVETACDQSVVKGKPEADRKAYADFLLESLRKGKNRELPYSAYFYNSKAVMKARLAVVEDTRERSGIPGTVVCIVLAALTVLMAADRMNAAREELWEQYASSQPQNIYEGYTPPESFTEEETQKMADLIGQYGVSAEEAARNTGAQGYDSLEEDSRNTGAQGYDSLEEDARESMPPELTAEGPWQVQNGETPAQAAEALAYRFAMYYEDQEAGSRLHSDLLVDSGFYLMDRLGSRVLAENGEEAVCALRFRFLAENKSALSGLRQLPGMQSGYDDGYEQLYFDWAVRIRNINETEKVWELEGAALLDDVLSACEEAGTAVETGFMELDLWELPQYRARTVNQVTEVTWNYGEGWQEVPIAFEDLTARGDQMDGALTGVQEKSYVVSEDMAAFAYGGSSEVPVTVAWTKDQGKNWTTSVVTHDYTSVRRLFLSFPDAEHGFLVLTDGRTMWQEGDVLFRTEDGGFTWTEVERETPPGYGGSHSLTMGAEFITPEVGFTAIRSSQEPLLYRTEDGGVNWEQCSFPPASGAEYVESYTMAYPPEQKEDRLCIYLSMEEYSELGGTKLRYESQDLGKTWVYTGEVMRK